MVNGDIAESILIKKKYPDRIPVIIKVAKGSNIILDKSKFLVPDSHTVGQFMHLLRKRVKLDRDEAMFLYTEDMHLPVVSMRMDRVFKEYGNADGFLYMSLLKESAFG